MSLAVTIKRFPKEALLPLPRPSPNNEAAQSDTSGSGIKGSDTSGSGIKGSDTSESGTLIAGSLLEAALDLWLTHLQVRC